MEMPMKWNSATRRLVVCWSLTALGLCVVALRARADAVGAWHEDPRRPSAKLTEGAPVGGADPWHTDVRRPAAPLTDNASVSSADPWNQDLRRPDNLDGGTDDSGVTPWRIDDRRPAAWPGSDEVTYKDSDHDGVPDDRDRCPDTPKTDAADANGCTILFHKGTRSVILRGVTFMPGRATLTPEAREILRDVASQLVENPQYKVQVSGHTDIRGTRARNLRLSQARARTVETFLEANGVPPTQVTAKGFGPDVPIASNKTAAGRAKNRRVELNRTN